jgi:hypothetical protein
MTLAAMAYAKAMHRRRLMAPTALIGPGAINLLTAAGVAHVNRLPALLLSGDVFANGGPDPVRQQVEAFKGATMGVTHCFRPVPPPRACAASSTRPAAGRRSISISTLARVRLTGTCSSARWPRSASTAS